MTDIHSCSYYCDRPECIKAQRDELRDKMAQPEQEPVARVIDDGTPEGATEWIPFTNRVEPLKTGDLLYTTPQPQEFVCSTGLCHFNLTQTNVNIGERGMETYEAAKERGWVGLSDERLMEMPKQAPVAIDGNTSDGYHTFNELYEFRKAYNAALFNEWAAGGKCSVHKSWRHHDGELCFGGGWFIVVAVLPNGQISNHYEAKDWNLFGVLETERALFEFDGHTGADVIARLKAYTTPPQRKPLTDEQITKIYTKWECTKGTSWADLMRLVEAAHDIKE